MAKTYRPELKAAILQTSQPVHAGRAFEGNKTTIAALLRHMERRKMPPDQEFLLYPLDTGEDPLCPRCHLPMLLAPHEARDGKPDFLTFRSEQCGRSATFVCENDAAD